MKPKVLILTDWFVPGYKAGGPIQSVYNLILNLQTRIDFFVITGDRDLNSSNHYKVEAFDKILERPWGNVIYTSAQARSHIVNQHICNEQYDWVYLNSMFSVDFTLKPIFRAYSRKQLDRIIIAPRGMLGEGALKLKGFKKQLFLILFKGLSLHKKLIFHSTDASETKDIKKVFGNEIKLVQVGNIPAVFDLDPKAVKSAELRFVFASRVSPKKNLLAAMRHIDQSEVTCHMSIYGEVEDQDYLNQCMRVFANQEQLTIHGAIEPNVLHQAIRDHDFFILPTLNENFGHAIIESLSLGVPVIISDQTPWNDLENSGAGWVIPLQNTSRWIEVIKLASQLSNDEYSQMSKNAIEYVRSKIDIALICEAYISMFNVQQN